MLFSSIHLLYMISYLRKLHKLESLQTNGVDRSKNATILNNGSFLNFSSFFTPKGFKVS